mmetsp:Transcript_13277/g.22533  ORF Transcript_13277/g.22533 Transcript_13277/m.22533 type:complete len:85 (-) Transcript_13277:379-633(-)
MHVQLEEERLIYQAVSYSRHDELKNTAEVKILSHRKSKFFLTTVGVNPFGFFLSCEFLRSPTDYQIVFEASCSFSPQSGSFRTN